MQVSDRTDSEQHVVDEAEREYHRHDEAGNHHHPADTRPFGKRRSPSNIPVAGASAMDGSGDGVPKMLDVTHRVVGPEGKARDVDEEDDGGDDPQHVRDGDR